jgi:hypothetical protein
LGVRFEDGVPIRLLFAHSRGPDDICDKEGPIQCVFAVTMFLD